MGFDIAFLYAMRGYATTVYDASSVVMESAADRTNRTIERLKRSGRISEHEEGNVQRGLRIAREFRAMARLDLITEAVSETAKTKAAVYRSLTDIGFKGLLTTNTSSLPQAVLLADRVYESAKFATTHFFNPVLYTQMVEVVKGDMKESHFNSTLGFLKTLDRRPVETRDISGFVSNSLLMYYAVMALHILESGARIEQIDQAAKLLGLLPPFVSFDSWKPSIVEDATRVMFETRGDEFLRSSKLLSWLADTNPKFYVEQKPNPAIYGWIGQQRKAPEEAIIKTALISCLSAAAARTVELGEEPSKVDYIAVEGIKIPQPPLKSIDAVGPAALLNDLDRIAKEMPDRALAPPAILVAMASAKQTFYRDGRDNPWIADYLAQQKPYGSH